MAVPLVGVVPEESDSITRFGDQQPMMLLQGKQKKKKGFCKWD